jgi:hypothetical protein
MHTLVIKYWVRVLSLHLLRLVDNTRFMLELIGNKYVLAEVGWQSIGTLDLNSEEDLLTH